MWKDPCLAKAEADNSGTQRQTELMTESVWRPQRRKKGLLLNMPSPMEALKSNGDRQVPEAARGHTPFLAPTEHASVCAPGESASGRETVYPRSIFVILGSLA